MTAIYVVVNAAFLHALGFAGVRQADAVAADVVRLAAGDWGAAPSACSWRFGAGHHQRHALHRCPNLLRPGHRAPLVSPAGRVACGLRFAGGLAGRPGAITLALVLAFGWSAGAGRDAFERMVSYALPAFWFFLLWSGWRSFACAGLSRRSRGPIARRATR